MENYYLDTCIWRDYFENRKDRFRPLGEWAFRLLKKIIYNKEKVMYSDLVVSELLNYFDRDKIKEIFSIVKNDFLEKVDIKKHHGEEAFDLKEKEGIPFGDALHAVLAKENNAILVTRDKHFRKLLKIVKIRKPEELI